MKVLKGHIIHTPAFGELECYEDHYLVEKDGKVVEISKELKADYQDYEFIDYGDQLIIPSFVDLHLHAPQYANVGLGMDLELIPWLNTYTFPEEAKYQDLDYANESYQRLAKDMHRVGSLRSCIFSSIHADATIRLMEIFDQAGLSAYIGKVNMDRNGGDNYQEESADQSIQETLKVISACVQFSDRIRPILTPRFIPTCSDELMGKIGQLAQERGLALQSHLNENLDEIQWVRELDPDSANYLDAYKRQGALPKGRTIMAHSIYNKETELELMAEKDIFVAHCPNSNINIMSGIAKVKQMIERGIPVGLGSDIAGGDSLNMLDNIKEAIKSSKMLSLYEGSKSDILTFQEAFYLATKGGGAFFGQVGDFTPGSSFDVLVIDDSSYRLKNLSLAERLEMLIYHGHDRQIVGRYLEGKSVDQPIFE